ncbi:MAG: hypothetical protein AAGN15_19420 [Cyanobacteria bacterium J06581_3]
MSLNEKIISEQTQKAKSNIAQRQLTKEASQQTGLKRMSRRRNRRRGFKPRRRGRPARTISGGSH